MDRDVFLTRVGQAALTSRLPPPPPVSLRLPELEPTDLVNLFRAQVQRLNAVVHGPVSRHGVPRVVVGIAAGHEARSFLAWDDLPASGVASALISAGMERVDHTLPDDDRLQHNLSYLDLDVGITGSLVALAETGSLVLSHGKGRPRMASLIAEVHIALVELSSLERSISDWAHKNPKAVSQTTNLVVITGPSRTADIEQELNLGVHGPRHLHVVMIK